MAGGMNVYNYVQNSPTDRTNSNGLDDSDHGVAAAHGPGESANVALGCLPAVYDFAFN